MKKFVIGFLAGAILFTLLGVLAVEYNVVPNPYKIKVDGEFREIEGYNINGYGYFKLRDIGEIAGFDVDFKEDVILIENKIMTDNVDSEDIQTQEILAQQDEIEYVRIYDIRWTHSSYFNKETEIKVSINYGYDYGDDNSVKAILLAYYEDLKSNDKTIFLEIPESDYLYVDELPCVTLEYYETVILPAIKEVLEKYDLADSIETLKR